MFGAITLYKDDSSIFSSDGYIIEATSKANKKYYFSANTEYKKNVDEKIVFSDVDDNKVSIDPASFVHYSNGDVTFLKKGALVNLDEINSSMINYYSITNKTTINYDKGSYVVSSNDKKINIETFLGRISDNKYLVSGVELNLKVPQNEELIHGEYFEILFIEDGIVKIDNEKASYQVAAQDTYLYVGDNITMDLGSGKIIYDGEAKMLISQLTINNDENISLDVDEDKNSGGGGGGGSGAGTGNGDGEGEGEGDGSGGGSGSGEGEGDGTGSGSGSGSGTGDGTGEGDGTGSGSGGGSGSGEGEGDGTGSGSGGGAGGTGIADGTLSVQIELIEAMITSTTIDLSLQLNNASLAKGNLLYYFTNISTGKREGNSQYIDLVNGTFYVSQESLSPSTDYSFTIVETSEEGNRQYFQKTFTTKDLGITLEKIYASQDSLAYKLIFDENADVSQARVSIFDENGKNDTINNNQVIISRDDIKGEVVFEGLKSDTTYAVSVDMVWINNAAYSDVYSINRMDSTLKKTPIISGVTVDANAEEVKFDIGLKNISDPDKAIEKYIYNIYLADDITVDNLEPTPVYSVVKNDSDNLILNLNEINELITGVDYRCKIFAEYNDNEMVREVSTEFSGNFLIKSKPKISFELTSATMNSVDGVLSLIDANCTVPMNGRTCDSRSNNFTLRYYKTSEDEHNLNDTNISFDSKTLTYNMQLSNLESNTTYAVKLFGNYYDDDNALHANVQIGDTFFVKTDKSDNIYFEVIGDNISGQNKDGSENFDNVVTFDARLTAPQDSDVMNEISTITLNLYSGRYNVSDKLIGTYVINDRAKIEDFFNNITISNSLFNDVTGKMLGNLNTLDKMIKVTNNMTKTLNQAYTVEVVDVFDSTGKNMITVENNIYTFNLTPSYYLDSRIESNPKETYITVTPITKDNLTEEEYDNLKKDVKNLDELDNKTVVGVIFENSLSDIFVDSAFTYEKVVVDYTIYNSTTKKSIKTISVDMGNKYQPKAQTIWLDSSELDDGKKYFTRGYNYKFGFELHFTTEDGSNPSYTKDELYKNVVIERQEPKYVQYIFNSDDNGITYRYKFSDIDNALYDKNFYYTLGDSKEYKSVSGLVSDDKYHDVVIPFGNNTNYSLYYAKRNARDEVSYVPITSYTFEKEFKYDDTVSYEIINDNSNILKLKLLDNDIISRAYAYKVTLKSDGIDDYSRYFLASQLPILKTFSGYGTEGEELYIDNKYIAIDYANIIDFMGHDMEIEVLCYYDSGKVGINQKFDYGMVLKNNQTGEYLNTYYQGKEKPTSGVGNNAMGIYNVRDYKIDDSKIFIYNQLVYDPDDKIFDIVGIESIKGLNLNDHGINYGISYSSNGLIFNNNKDYEGYDFRVLNRANLNTTNNKFTFDTIIPSVSVTTNNTINSVVVNIDPDGVYENKQFVKDGKSHNKIYVNFYNSLETLQNGGEKIATVSGDVSGSGDNAKVDTIELKNLVPNTKYYYTVTAWIDNKETRLFDSGVIASRNQYVSLEYETSTLGVKDILERFTFSVKPTSYNGKYPMNTLSWRLGLKSTKNYSIRYELYKQDGVNTSIDSETGLEVVTPNYVAVKFNGTDASGCDITKYGNSDNGYVNGCYINVNKSDVSSINNKLSTYKFSNNFDEVDGKIPNGFVFGDGYYKLVVYAIPYTNDKYDEDNKVVLYETNKLSNMQNVVDDKGITYNVSIPYLEEASFAIKNLNVGYNATDSSWISFVPEVTNKDVHYVMSGGKYTVSLQDVDGNRVGEVQEVTYPSANTTIKFNKLNSNTLYYVVINYTTYRNNVGFVEEQKTITTPFTDFTYTPFRDDITIGTITARQNNNKSITLAYNGSSNLSGNITKVMYTISLKGGSSKVSGTYEVNGSNIFVIGSDDIPRLTIDVSGGNSSNTGFTFKNGNTYIITTQYYVGDHLLTDQQTGKSTLTTLLNL